MQSDGRNMETESRSCLRVALRVFCSLAAGCVFASSADATTVTTGTVLPGAISYQYFGLNFASNILTSDIVGTLDYTGQPGCGGICSATTQLGPSPFVSAVVNEVIFEAAGGGIVQASLAYYVAFLNSPGTYDVNLHAISSLSAPDGASMSAHLVFGPAGSSTTSLNNFASVTFEEAYCLNGCPPPGFVANVVTSGPFLPDNLVPMVANTLYMIRLDLLFRPNPSGVQISGLVDPVFSAASGGQFVFSPGVSPIPEPGTWLLMLAGLCWLAGVARTHSARSPA